MANAGRLELEVVDVDGDPIAELVDIHLRHRVLHEQRRADNVDAGSIIGILDLRTETVKRR